MKKKVFSIVILLGVFFAAMGQDTARYQSFFGKDSTIWYGITKPWDGEYINRTMKSSYDTIIDSVTYTKILYSTIYKQNTGELWERRVPEVDFYLREESDSGRLWCRLQKESKDFLLADMSLQSGDTCLLRMLSEAGRYYEFVVEKIDTIDGLKRITLHLSTYPAEKVEFIESVGSSSLFDIVEDWLNYRKSHVMCCYHNDERIYRNNSNSLFIFKNSIIEDCMIWKRNSILDIMNTNGISIYPNPCNDWISISGDNIKSISIYDIYGKRMRIYTPKGERIDVSSFQKGLYFINITHENSTTSSVSFIKE